MVLNLTTLGRRYIFFPFGGYPIPTINIAGTPIDFPDSGTSPDWANSVDQFALAVESALSGLAGAFDVSPQTLNIDSANPQTLPADIVALNFPPSSVRSAFIQYSVYRLTTSTSGVETGTLIVVYNPAGSIGNKWELARDVVGPGASIDFTILDSGQVQYTTTALAGTNHTGLITFSAKALKNS